MKAFITLFLILFLSSCSDHNNEQLLNSFLKDNHLRLKNLSAEPFYLEEALRNWKEEEFTQFKFTIPRNEKYRTDTASVQNRFSDPDSFCKTRISRPLISKDAAKALIGIQVRCGIDEDLTVYLLKKKGNSWVLETSINHTRSFTP